MFRFLFRLTSTIMLAVGVIMAVLDVTRTIAAGRPVLTSLEASWRSVAPGTLAQTQSFIMENGHPLIWNPMATFIIGQPGFAVFGVLALLFYAIGHRPERRVGRFAAEH